MKFSLSTNWCNRETDDARRLAEQALALGFDELELGYRTTDRQVPGFKAMIEKIPVGSVHAFCPVPLSAPHGYPELYSLASFDDETRRMAVLQVLRNIEFAADMGADAVVLHAGRVSFSRFLDRVDTGALRKVRLDNEQGVESAAYKKMFSRAEKRRRRRGEKMLEIFKQTLEGIVPVLERRHVTLALENLPYFEGFPAEWELASLVATFKGAPVRGWFDTGHDRIRQMYGWRRGGYPADLAGFARDNLAGMHLNDVVDFDDEHLAPGDGKVDFAALKEMARNVRHVVFEPSSEVSEASLRRGLAYIRSLWND